VKIVARLKDAIACCCNACGAEFIVATSNRQTEEPAVAADKKEQHSVAADKKPPRS